MVVQRLWQRAKNLVRNRIFLKYMLVTIAIGGALNTLVLFAYFERRSEAQTDQVAAEIATLANKIGRPAAELASAGEIGQARALLAVFSGFPYTICADLRLAGDTLAVAWPAPGCDRIKRQGDDVVVQLSSAGPGANILIRIDPKILASELRTEILVVIILGVFGGFALILSGAAAFLWLINRPLARLLAAIGHFEQRNEPQKVDHDTTDEIGRVITGYNSMLDREVERVAEVQSAHREIIDSVTYATRIQRALLPTEAQCAAAFSDFDVLWQPRDLVGGDIYWVRQSGPITTLAVVDCTGHGVPGGFMTMLAVSTLERIFAEDETITPGPALSRLSDLTREMLARDDPDASSNDGMDAAICQMNVATGRTEFAGARLSMLVVADGEVTRLRGDKIEVGYPDTPVAPSFYEHKVELKQGSLALIVTDGAIDQIGGPKRLAFGYRRLLAEIQNTAGAQAADVIAGLSNALQVYAGNEARRDDLTILAFAPCVPNDSNI
jgi:serine phosphatase RsbU (regulator of sigma subunit)